MTPWIILYFTIGIVFAFWQVRKSMFESGKPDYSDYATAGYLFFCFSLLWPLIGFFVGIGALLSVGKSKARF